MSTTECTECGHKFFIGADEIKSSLIVKDLEAALAAEKTKIYLKDQALKFTNNLILAEIKDCLNPNLTNNEQLERVKEKVIELTPPNGDLKERK